MSAPNLAATLDRLAQRGWIERVRSLEDRRAMQLHLTPAGQALVAKAEAIAATMETPHLAMLSTAERALLIELLLKVAAGPGVP
jgi:DNA-binding MarR family transcriptional regulator